MNRPGGTVPYRSDGGECLTFWKGPVQGTRISFYACGTDSFWARGGTNSWMKINSCDSFVESGWIPGINILKDTVITPAVVVLCKRNQITIVNPWKGSNDNPCYFYFWIPSSGGPTKSRSIRETCRIHLHCLLGVTDSLFVCLPDLLTLLLIPQLISRDQKMMQEGMAPAHLPYGA